MFDGAGHGGWPLFGGLSFRGSTMDDEHKLCRWVAEKYGIKGADGGWLYLRNGKPLCNGWVAFKFLCRDRKIVTHIPGASTIIRKRVVLQGYVADWNRAAKAFDV